MTINLHGKVVTDRLLAQLETHGYYTEMGVAKSSNDSACQAIVDAYMLADFISDRQAEASAIAKRLRDTVVSGVSPGEMAAWPIKRAEAQAFAASGNPADAPLLSAEAADGGITLAALVASVAANAQFFAGMEAAIGGANRAHKNALAQLATFEQVAAYDVTSGWPAV